jgi:hypothetical protein
MPGIYVGDTKALVFPVMSDGYLKLDYSDYNQSNTELDLRGGFWGHQGNFSIEAIITPYDVNGYGTKTGGGVGYANSERTPPSLDQSISTRNTYQSENYFSHTTRKTHRMMIFYNNNVQFYLQNTTPNNLNQPAEYKIVLKIKDGSSAIGEAESGTVIRAVNRLYGYYNSDSLYDGITTSKTLLDATTTKVNTTITCDSTTTIEEGTEIFNSSGISMGTVTTVPSATTFTIADVSNYTASLYVSQPKEALYLDTIYKIGCSYSTTGNIKLYINGDVIAEEKVSKKVAFDPSDSYIGQDGSTKTTQFMGKLYEISMYKRATPTSSTMTLSPGYYDILFYYRFGDE